MSYQVKGLQLSLLIHAAIFSLIMCTDISESRLNTPMVIGFSLIKEAEEEKAEPEPEPLHQAEESKMEDRPRVQEIAPQPQIKAEPIEKKEKELPVRAEKSKTSKEKPKKIVRAEKKESPPVKKQVSENKEKILPATQAKDEIPPVKENKEENPPVKQPAENTVREQSASSAADTAPSDTENHLPAQSFPENSPVAASVPASGGSGSFSSDSKRGSGGGSSSYSKAGSGGTASSASGSEIASSGNSAFGSPGGPKYRHKEIPVYPALARRLGKEGKVLLRLTIDENGDLVNAEVIEDSGYGFADAALAAVKRSVFIPPTLNGRPVRSRALLPVTFTLR